MKNFISEDDIEHAILTKLREPSFDYDIIQCDADPSKREGRRIETRDPTVPGTLETDIKVQAIQEGHEERCDRDTKG